MDAEERLRLEKIYSEMTDEEILQILLGDEGEYQRDPYEAYALIKREADKRGIYAKFQEMKQADAQAERHHTEKVELEIVYCGTATKAGFAKNILEMNGIDAFLRDEALGTIAPHYVSPVFGGVVKVVVARKHADEAKAILNDYLNGKE